MRTSCVALLLVVAVSALAGCRPGGPIRIASVQLGRALNSDNSVGAHTTQFKPSDTFYVAVLTEEPGAGTLTVQWRLNDQIVSEATKEVSYMRPAATEFHLQNSGGFPVGQYRVDVLVDGTLAESREFRVIDS
jgi:hypothetical protein